MSIPSDIILYHYPFSPYARRITWYLALRRIPYAQCLQPPTLPRPDINALGISYRRIPVCSIGPDIYCDTRIILSALESHFPNSPLAASSPEHKAIEALLSRWAIDGGVFARAAQLIPPEMPLLKDSKFTKDREQYTGRSWSADNVKKMRPEALAHIRLEFDFLEKGLLADGREWILGTENPMLADVEAIWPFHWLTTLPSALPPSLISPTTHPHVFAWITRFSACIKSASSTLSKPTSLTGSAAAQHILSLPPSAFDTSVDANDPLQLTQGQDVEIWPIDSGFSHKDRGKLVGLSLRECVISVKSQDSGKEVLVHFPRTNFRIRALVAAGSSL
ncbi:hypothetical protein MMC20_003324 [Loxospora ochrophaea]|nr:hypothetical protein [Loxospora ochrophaea]